MTKYVLNSGGLRKNEARAKQFIAEIVEGLGSRPKILFCFFAEKREDWEEKFKNYTKGFKEWLEGKAQPEFELAFPDKFIEQVRKSDAIYIHGGDDHLVQYWLKQFNLKDIFKNKVVATNSAGSDAVVKYYWTCDWRECQEGLGIVPIKFIPHYKSDYGYEDPRGPIDWEEVHHELENFGDKSLPIYALEGGDFRVFQIGE